MVFIYLIIPGLLVSLWFLAKDEELDQDVSEEGISRALLKISLFIYRKCVKKSGFFWGQKVRDYLSMLNGRKDLEKKIAYYYAHKISVTLLLAVCGSILSLVFYATERLNSPVSDGKSIERNAPGMGTRDMDLVAMGDNGQKIGEFHVEVEEQKYSEKEAEEMFDLASQELPKEILGKNESLDHVNDDLKLIKQMEGYPFELSWSVDNLDICNYSGEIDFDNVPDDGAVITLTATYKYNEHRWEQIIYAHVTTPELTSQQIVQKEMKALLSSKQKESEYEERMSLPESFHEEGVIWSEKREDTGLWLLLFMIVGGAVSFVLKDKELKQKIEDRNNQLIMEYPGLVSQMVLYLGAGMTMRNIVARLSENYSRKRENGVPQSVVYEELVKSNRELKLGKSEVSVYEDFGRRCTGQQYARLSTLLSQNLRKGNSELLRLLNEESMKAFEDRLDRARKAGEEAGTKLLLPMVLMLLIVMVIIMIPAYMTF